MRIIFSSNVKAAYGIVLALTVKGEWNVKTGLGCLLLELAKSLSSGSSSEVLCVRREAER